MTKKIVLHAFSAYVGSIRGATTVRFWTEDPGDGSVNWQRGQLIELDLSRNTTAAKNGQITWDQVDVDDFTLDGGLTTLGPRYPGGSMIGAVWLTESFMGRKGIQVARKPQHAHDHELRALLHIDASNKFAGRYQGFHAKVINTHGKLTEVQIWNAGQGKLGGQSARFGLDLAAISDTTESDVPKKDGSLYIETDAKRVYLAGGGTGPKIPAASGL